MTRKKKIRRQQTAEAAGGMREHARVRALERYNIQLKSQDLKILENDLRGAREYCSFIYKKSNSRSIWKANYADQEIYFVYDTNKKVICTLLSKEMVESDLKKFEITRTQREIETGANYVNQILRVLVGE